MCTPDYLLGTENRRCSFFSVLLRGNKVAKERERGRNWVTISLNLQPTIPLLPLSSFYTSFLPPLLPFSLFLHSFHNSVYSRGIVSPLFSIMKANCATENQETRAWFGLYERYTNVFSLVQTDTVPIFSFEDASFTLGEGGEERRGEQVVPDVSK